MHPFEVMAEPVRRRILEILASGEHSSGELADVIGFEFRISPSAVSKHLRRMLDAGFVDVRADWNNRIYRLDEDGLCTLEAEVADLRAKWEGRIGWNGADDPAKTMVALKGTGRPSRRGGRGKGFARDRGAGVRRKTPRQVDAAAFGALSSLFARICEDWSTLSVA